MITVISDAVLGCVSASPKDRASVRELRRTAANAPATGANSGYVGRDILIGNTGLTERTNLLDVFLAELGPRLWPELLVMDAFMTRRMV